MTVYDKIEEVLKQLKAVGIEAVAPHEFANLSIITPPPTLGMVNCREYVGCSEATLGRRMREMVVIGRLSSKKRDGKTFKEFSLAVKPCHAVEPELAGQHSGGL